MVYDVVKENVPEFTRRLGDRVLQGSNNTLLILGTDRASSGPANVETGLGHSNASGGGKGTGTIHVIAGRSGKDPDLSADKSYIYLTMKSDVDTNLGLGSVESGNNLCAAAVMKSDHIRIVARKNVKITIDGGKNYVYIDGSYVIVKIGSNFVKLNSSELSADVGKSKINVTSVGEIKMTNGVCDMKIGLESIVAKGPMFKLGGIAAKQWRALFNNVLAIAANHSHMTIVGPTLPAGGVVAMTPSADMLPMGALAPLSPTPPNPVLFPAVLAQLQILDKMCFE